MDWARIVGGEAFFGAGEFAFHVFVEPVFEFELGTPGDVLEAESGKALDVGPGNFGFDFHVDGAAGQRKFETRRGAFRERFVQDEGDAAFADVGAGRVEDLVVEADFHLHLDGLAEVAAALLQHEVQRGMKTARGIECADGFLQDEVSAHSEGFLRGGSMAVQDGEGDGVLVAGSVAESLQEGEASVEVVAVDDDGVELVGYEDVGSGAGFLADFHVNGKLFERGPENPDQFGVLAKQQRLQGHNGILEAGEKVG